MSRARSIAEGRVRARGATLFLLGLAVVPSCSSRTELRGDRRPYDLVYDAAEVDAATRAYYSQCRTYAESEMEQPAIELADGVSRCEAKALADNHLGFIGCGGAGAPFDAGTYWLIPVWEGVAGVPSPPVRIDKRTGVATRGRIPNYDEPED